MTITNHLSQDVTVTYSKNGIERVLEDIAAGGSGGEYKVFTGEPNCLEGTLIARVGTGEVARKDHACQGDTWVIGP